MCRTSSIFLQFCSSLQNHVHLVMMCYRPFTTKSKLFRVFFTLLCKFRRGRQKQGDRYLCQYPLAKFLSEVMVTGNLKNNNTGEKTQRKGFKSSQRHPGLLTIFLSDSLFFLAFSKPFTVQLYVLLLNLQNSSSQKSFLDTGVTFSLIYTFLIPGISNCALTNLVFSEIVIIGPGHLAMEI